MNHQRRKKHGRSKTEYGERTLSSRSLADSRTFRKEIAEDGENGFGESNPIFCDRIHFVTEGK